MNCARRLVAGCAVALLAAATAFTGAAAAKAKPPRTGASDKAAAADRAAASAALLTLADLPPGDPSRGFRGWQGGAPTCTTQGGAAVPCPTPPVPAGGSSALAMGNPDAAFPACAESLAAETAASRYRVDASDFSANATAVGSSVYVFPTETKAKAYLAVYAKPDAKACYEHGVVSHANTAFSTVTTPDFDPSTLPSGSPDDGVGFAVVLTSVSGSTSPGSIAFQDVRYRAGRSVVFLQTYNDSYPDLAVAYFAGTTAALRTVADRLAQQLPK